MKMQSNSPSNIKTGWNQKFFYKIESDGMLDNFIKLFAQHGNNWSMKKENFDKIIAKNKLDKYFSFIPVRDEVLEIEDNLICFREYVAEDLLTNSWRWSLRNALKNWKKIAFIEMCIDAWAFVIDSEARTPSEFKYSNGYVMSVRCAKKEGLIK